MWLLLGQGEVSRGLYFFVGNPELNLHLWLASWVGGRSNVHPTKLHKLPPSFQTFYCQPTHPRSPRAKSGVVEVDRMLPGLIEQPLVKQSLSRWVVRCEVGGCVSGFVEKTQKIETTHQKELYRPVYNFGVGSKFCFTWLFFFGDSGFIFLLGVIYTHVGYRDCAVKSPSYLCVFFGF